MTDATATADDLARDLLADFALRDLLAACRHNRDSVGERVLEAMDRAEEVLG